MKRRPKKFTVMILQTNNEAWLYQEGDMALEKESGLIEGDMALQKKTWPERKRHGLTEGNTTLQGRKHSPTEGDDGSIEGSMVL